MASDGTLRFHQIPEALWQRIDLVIPIYKSNCKGGRPRLAMRNIVGGILYVLATGCQWKAMPRQFGSGSAIHAYFQEWVEAGVFQELWELALTEYDDLFGIDWQWQSLDGAMTKSPLGGEKNREKPNGSRQTRRQAFHTDRWSRRATGRGRGRRQCAGSETARRHARHHSDRTSGPFATRATASVSRQRLQRRTRGPSGSPTRLRAARSPQGQRTSKAEAPPRYRASLEG